MTDVQDRTRQGAHPDPLAPDYTPPDRSQMTDGWISALSSPQMAQYQRVLQAPGVTDIRAAVLDDLSAYYQLDPEECVRRCLHWESWSVEEWQAADRSTPEGLRAFYNSVQSWSFDQLWYAYLQAVGATYPITVVASQGLPPATGGTRCLDFGSGAGDAAQLMIEMGHTVDLADVSQTLLGFARWRLERRGQQAGYIDLNSARLPVNAYDAILAKDVLAHVPDFNVTVRTLRRALRPNGLLIANFDTRPPSPENAWHLYEDDIPLRRALQDIGFEQVGHLDHALFVYRRVPASGPAHLIRRVKNGVLLGPPRQVYRRVRAVMGRGQ